MSDLAAITDYERTYEDFWCEIVEKPAGTLNLDQIKRELHDYHELMDSASTVYNHVTGGRISKPNTDPDAVIAEHDDYLRRAIDEAVAEEVQLVKAE